MPPQRTVLALEARSSATDCLGSQVSPQMALVMKLPPRAAAAQVVSMGNPHIKIEESPFKLNYSHSSPFLIKHYQT